MAEFDESNYEKSIIELFQNLGYSYVYGPDVERDFHDALMSQQLSSSLTMLNPGMIPAAIQEAIYKIRNYEAGSLVSKNEVFMDYLGKRCLTTAAVK